MKIEEVHLECPKCGLKHTNNNLLSFYDGMANAAKNFVESNKNKNLRECPTCKINLIKEELVQKYFKDGEYKCNKRFSLSTNTLDFYNLLWYSFGGDSIVFILQDAIACVPTKAIEVEGQVYIEEQKQKDKTKLLVNPAADIVFSVIDQAGKKYPVLTTQMFSYAQKEEECMDRRTPALLSLTYGFMKELVRYYQKYLQTIDSFRKISVKKSLTYSAGAKEYVAKNKK